MRCGNDDIGTYALEVQDNDKSKSLARLLNKKLAKFVKEHMVVKKTWFKTSFSINLTVATFDKLIFVKISL